MTFLDVTSLKGISKPYQIMKMIMRAETKAKQNKKWTPPNNHQKKIKKNSSQERFNTKKNRWAWG